jgi:hypothetical protein
MIFLPVLLSVAIWAWLLVGHGAFWRSGRVLGAAHPTRRLKVTVVIPARDEAEHIADTLRSLLIQQFDGELKIVRRLCVRFAIVALEITCREDLCLVGEVISHLGAGTTNVPALTSDETNPSA